MGSVAGVRVTEETFPACVGKEADCGFHEFTVVTCFEAGEVVARRDLFAEEGPQRLRMQIVRELGPDFCRCLHVNVTVFCQTCHVCAVRLGTRGFVVLGVEQPCQLHLIRNLSCFSENITK